MREGRAAQPLRPAELLVFRPDPGLAADRARARRAVLGRLWQAYPNIKVTKQNLSYNEMLDKLRTAALGKAAPMVARLPILWGVEFAAKGQLREFGPADVGYNVDEFWPGALKSVTWKGKTFGVPTNNETMALIWNSGIFRDAGLDPGVAARDLGRSSSPTRARSRRRPGRTATAWSPASTPATRRSASCRSSGPTAAARSTRPRPARPTRAIYVNNAGSRAALQASYDMYVRDKSVPISALTNTQVENQDPFIAGNLAMMIAHPAEYAVMVERARKATGDDRKTADAVVSNMRYGLMPQGPARRAVVFGGSNAHVFRAGPRRRRPRPRRRQGHHRLRHRPGMVDQDGVGGLEPGQPARLSDQWMKQRLEQIRFLNVTTSMLAVRHPLPGAAAVRGDHEHRDPEHDAERAHEEDVGG